MSSKTDFLRYSACAAEALRSADSAWPLIADQSEAALVVLRSRTPSASQPPSLPADPAQAERALAAISLISRSVESARSSALALSRFDPALSDRLLSESSLMLEARRADPLASRERPAASAPVLP